jgi:hypothetical protein
MKALPIILLILSSHYCLSEAVGLQIVAQSGVDESKVQADNMQAADSAKNLSPGLHYNLSAAAIVTSNKTVPFWMRANKFGSEPSKGFSTALVGEIVKGYSRADKLTDWGFGAEGRLNIGKQTDALLIQGYVKGRLGIFQIKAGRSRDIVGLVDSTLSSGAFSISGNALGIPKIELSVPEYWSLPILDGIIAFKGNYAHGWMGSKDVDYASGARSVNTFLHQKSAYARFGKVNWRLKLFAGFNHQVMWGNEKKMNPTMFKLSTLETYKYVILGKSYGEKGTGLPLSKVGNHLGSIDQAFEYRFKNFRLNGYHQFFYEVGGLYHLNNVKDGLWGLSIVNSQYGSASRSLRVNKFLFEFMNTKSQGGEIDAKITPSGDEDYYNNYVYKNGWTYKGANLGNALLTTKKYARENLPARNEYFVNNRVQAYHVGVDGALSKYAFVCRLTFTQNFGTYGSSPLGHSLNEIRSPSKPPYFGTENQFSGLLEASRNLKGVNIGMCVAVDRGTMIYNASGIWLKVTKSW